MTSTIFFKAQDLKVEIEECMKEIDIDSFAYDRFDEALSAAEDIKNQMQYIEKPELYSEMLANNRRTWETKDEEIARLKEENAQVKSELETAYTRLAKQDDIIDFLFGRMKGEKL